MDVILLTTKHIEIWEEEKRSLENEISELQAELSIVRLKLQSAHLLAAKRGTPTPGVPVKIGLPATILTLVKTKTTGLTTPEIRAELKRIGVDNPSLSGGYFYKMLRNLEKKRQLKKGADGRWIVPGIEKPLPIKKPKLAENEETLNVDSFHY